MPKYRLRLDSMVWPVAAIAKQERVRHGERTKAARQRKQAAGVVLGRPGVSTNTVARIKQLRGEGLSVRAITARLQADGVEVSKSAVGKYC